MSSSASSALARVLQDGDFQAADGAIWDASAVDVWRVDLARSLAENVEDQLTGPERQRAQRLIVPAKRTQFMATRAALRTILAGYLDLDSRRVEFRVTEHGKLFVAAGIWFNVSHSGDVALIVCFRPPVATSCSESSWLGVDVERVRSGRPLDRMATRFFHQHESAAFGALSEGERERDFYRRWALKEAYVKALGTGLSYSSRRFALHDDEPTWCWRPLLRECQRQREELDVWQFANGWLEHRGSLYAVALCLPETAPRVRFIDYSTLSGMVARSRV